MATKRRLQKYSVKYAEEFDFIRLSRKGDTFAYCVSCNCDISISHGGRTDIVSHSRTAKHNANCKAVEKLPKVHNFFVSDTRELQPIRAEVLFTSFLLEHNIPLAAADHASRLLPVMFPQSSEVKNYACGRTKTLAIVREMARSSTTSLVEAMKNWPFSIATDASNDADDKLYPIVVTVYDPTLGQIKCSLLSVPALENDSTGENIAKLLISEMESRGIPRTNCIALASDNAAVMVGKNRGVISFLKKEHPSMISLGCVCHLLHLAAEKGAERLLYSIDELLIDIFYFLQKSVKRKQNLKKFQQMCDAEVQKILKHTCTRWLSLGRCLDRLLVQWRPLLLYFKEECSAKLSAPKMLIKHSVKHQIEDKVPKRQAISLNANENKKLRKEDESSEKEQKKNQKMDVHSNTASSTTIRNKKKKDAVISKGNHIAPPEKTGAKSAELTREERIFMCLSSQTCHACALFLQNVINIFESRNTLLQTEAPLIHEVRSELEGLLSDLLQRFIKTEVIKSCPSLLHVKYRDVHNQKDDEHLVIGSETKAVVRNMPEKDKKEFFKSVRNYYTTVCDYVLEKFPLESEILGKAEVVKIEKRGNFEFSSVSYFIEKFPCMLLKKGGETDFHAFDELQNQYLRYQIADIPLEVSSQCRIDEKWAMLSTLKGTAGNLLFDRLSKVMLSILTLPHSNASCERVFSQVRKNKTAFRASMSNETLQAILIAKGNQNGPCYTQNYDQSFLQKAKSATCMQLQQTSGKQEN